MTDERLREGTGWNAQAARRLCGGLVGAWVGAWLGIQPVGSDLHGSKAAISAAAAPSHGASPAHAAVSPPAPLRTDKQEESRSQAAGWI